MNLFENDKNALGTDIAIVGLSCRFPGADNVEEFWRNLINRVESIREFSKEELKAAGEKEELLDNAHYVKSKGILNNIEQFDANFFGYNASDARITDPQQRIFLECAWEALESAGYTSEKFNGLIGVYASMADSLYLQNNLLKNKEVLQSLDWFQARIATSLTTLSTQLSYRLNLKGPSINVTTACSSSLVAIAMACKGLVEYDCDIAIAGAAAIAVPQERGYLYQEEGIESPDGHCRSFDADAKGTVFSNGVGVVVLKRLQDAVSDGDFIYSLIKGWNVNNDGSHKVGFSAPSVSGQSRCIVSALAFADVNPDSITYIETHGTATAVGDPIEINALTDAFKVNTDEKQFCAIGSVKTNIGHTDIAAGMASFIKVALALKNKVIPATLHYRKPNPEIDFSHTPFYVNAKLKQWDFGGIPRRAGVNASGIGGTNAFLVLEEYNQPPEIDQDRPYQLILLSAKTKTALEKMTENLSKHLDNSHTQNDLANIAYTLQIGRADFDYRRMLVCKDVQDTCATLKQISSKRIFTRNHQSHFQPRIVFMFSGQGSQYVGMAEGLYRTEPEFAKWINYCCDRLDQKIRENVCALLLGKSQENLEMNDTLIVQPALFILEYSLAKFLMSLGIQPDAMIGHSIGEYIAACIAEVINVEDGLKLVSHRAQLMSKTSPGSMLAVQMEKNELLDFMGQSKISLAAVNTPTNCVVSGESHLIDQFQEKCKHQGIPCRKLKTSHAFHSRLMDPVLESFRACFEHVQLKTPKIPLISNLTGNWIKEEEATNSLYWMSHLRETVQFLSGIETLMDHSHNIYVEVGPGRTLTNLSQEILKVKTEICLQNSLPGFTEQIAAEECFLLLLGKLWLYGIKIDWTAFYQYEKRARKPLPTYPFERKYYWINPDHTEEKLVSTQKQPYEKWFYEPSWVRSSFQSLSNIQKSNCWFILLDGHGMGETLCEILKNQNQQVIKIKSGQNFSQINNNQYTINYRKKEDYSNLVKIVDTISVPIYVINLLPLTFEHDINNFSLTEIQETVYQSFYSTLFFVQAIVEQQYDKTINFTTVGNELYSVIGNENIYPAKATAAGPCRVIPQEHPKLKLRIIDLVLSDFENKDKKIAACHQIILDTFSYQADANENIIAYRQQFRWIQRFQTLKFKTNQKLNLRPEGVYLLTGGLGGISLTLAKFIAATAKKSRLCLISRSCFPKQEEWQNWLANHPQDNSISHKILKLLEIQNLGADIILFNGDTTNLDQISLIIHEIKERFGGIHGVVHAAGVPGGGLAQLKSEEMATKVFAPKVEGTYILTHLLRDEPLDFFMLCSSVSSVVGELSQIDYCAANACLDAFAQVTIFKSPVILKSVNWNTWREVGMAVETERPADVTYFDRNNDIMPEEGARIFADVLHNNYKHVIVSTIDINTFIDLIDSNKNTMISSISAQNNDTLENNENYQPPGSDIEKKLVTLWQRAFGIKNIGITDDFVTLGGHSLMALRLVTQIERTFKIKISLKALQEASTIQTLAEFIQNATITDDKTSSIILPIRSGNKKTTLWCFHPVGGNVFCYLDLANYLLLDLSIYGVQDPCIHKNEFIYGSLKDMASSYIKAIQQIQPNGPYLLSGLSFGATLSVEVASQLRDQGHEIKPLIFFDGWAKFSNQQKIKTLFTEAMQRYNQKSFEDKKFIEFSWKRMNLLLDYEVPKIKEKIILFKAKDLLPEYREIDTQYNYWDNYTEGTIEVHAVPGDHETILCEPNVLVLAKKLNKSLVKILS